jgi:hypothetical protein
MSDIGGAVGLAGILATALLAYLGYCERQASRMEDRLFDALSWFEGGTQKRSIGIAVVEGYWSKLPAYRGTLIPLLANQAIYLLSESDTGTDHERNNLERMMRLILRETTSLRADYGHLHTELLDLTSSGSVRRGKTGQSVDGKTLKSWHDSLR